jgi:hypothetical protein
MHKITRIFHQTEGLSIDKAFLIYLLENHQFSYKEETKNFRNQKITGYVFKNRIRAKMTKIDGFNKDIWRVTSTDINLGYKFENCYYIPAITDSFSICYLNMLQTDIYITDLITGCSFYIINDTLIKRSIATHINWKTLKSHGQKNKSFGDIIAISHIIEKHTSGTADFIGFDEDGYLQIENEIIKYLNKRFFSRNVSINQDYRIGTMESPIQVIFYKNTLFVFVTATTNERMGVSFKKYSFLLEVQDTNYFKIVDSLCHLN